MSTRGRRSETLAFSMVTDINTAVARLVRIWDSIGIMEEQRVDRMLTAKKHIERLLNEMVAEEEALEQRIRNHITTLQQQMEELCLELDMEPSVLDEGLTKLQRQKDLRVRVEALGAEKTERVRELVALQKQDQELCVELSATPYYVPTGTTPSLKQLQELRQHVATLSEEKTRRVAVFSGLREDIWRLMEEMGHEPESSLERDSISNDKDAFLLTHDNITTLKQILAMLEAKKESLEQILGQLKERAVCLWNRLDCSEQERTTFQANLHGTLADKITQWRCEVERMTEQQRVRLEEVVGKIRQELLSLWDLCTFSPQQREAFNTHFYNTEYTEELLAQHDAELLRVKSFYEQARPLLEALQRWEKNWALHQDFEKKANDPNRFSNRGGALLKEAKERGKVQKMLPKLEEELRLGVELWEQSHGSDFLVWGQKVMSYIASQWEEYRQQKDKERIERQQQTKTTPFKTPTKRALGSLSCPSPSKIRKTPSQSAVMGSTSSVSSSSSNSGSSTKPPLSSHKVKARPVEGSTSNQRPPLLVLNRGQNPSETFSYSDFTSELSRKAQRDAVLNSTVKDAPDSSSVFL